MKYLVKPSAKFQKNLEIIIKKYKKAAKHKTIQERFTDFEEESTPIEINWGKPEGEEMW